MLGRRGHHRGDSCRCGLWNLSSVVQILEVVLDVGGPIGVGCRTIRVAANDFRSHILHGLGANTRTRRSLCGGAIYACWRLPDAIRCSGIDNLRGVSVYIMY